MFCDGSLGGLTYHLLQIRYLPDYLVVFLVSFTSMEVAHEGKE